MGPLRFRKPRILAQRSKFGLALSSYSTFQVSLVSRKTMQLLAKELSLQSEARFSRTEETLLKAADLNGEVPEEESDSILELALEEDLQSAFEADSAVLLFL